MINFASLFGSFNRGGNSAIFDLLQRPQTSLDQLLDIETFSNEYKSGNSKVQEFMKYDKYIELIKYVTVEGPANNQKKGFKFPMVAADILSTQNNAAIEYFLPDKTITVDVLYDQDEQYEREVQDTEQPQTPQPVITPQPVTAGQQVKANQQTKSQEPLAQGQKQSSTQQQPSVLQQPLVSQQISAQQKPSVQSQTSVESQKKVRTKWIKQSRRVTKVRRQARQPLMDQLMSYFEGPINYTLAGYTCKVLTIFFTKKPNHFNRFIYNSNKNYVQLMCKHIQSKSVGDLVTKMLLAENVDFVEQRKTLYNHLIALMGEVTAPHIISNLAYTIQQIIQKSSVYIKTKNNIVQNQPIIQKFLSIFYRTQQVHKILNNAMSQDENKSGYNCLILHAYLHHTELETFNNFKLEQVLDSFICKATDKLRQIPQRRTLGMGRVKLVQIFSFLVRKQKKTLEDDTTKQAQLTPQLLQELYLHQLIAAVPDFFTILIKLVQSFDKNNILHNQVFKILQAVLKQPQQNRSALQQLLLNEQNVLLKFIVSQTQKDQQLKDKERLTKRKGYIGHVVNVCKLINDISNNELLNQRIRSNSSFQQVLGTMVSDDVTQASKNLAGYQMKKIKAHQIMFQKQEIISVYSAFLSHCPKPQFQAEQKSQSEEQPDKVVIQVQTKTDVLAQEQNDEQKFNEAASKEAVDQFNPKFWINHIHYDTHDLQSLMNDL